MQIGNAIAEKKVLDVMLQARDAGLYRAITDCGAGGFSSAVGEMGEKLGAHVDLDKAPLKYAGLSLHGDLDQRVAGAHGPGRAAGPVASSFGKLCQGEDVEATVLGHFEATGQLRLFYQGEAGRRLDDGVSARRSARRGPCSQAVKSAGDNKR